MSDSVDPMATSAPVAPATLRLGIGFLLAVAAAVGLTLADPYLSSMLSPRVWEKMHLASSPVKALFLVLPLAVLGALALGALLRLKGENAVMIVVLTVAVHTNGLRIAGLDLITAFPFVVVGWVLARCLVQPWRPLHLTGISFAALAMLWLALPHMADTNVYGPARFLINWISTLKGVAVALAMILIIDDRRDLGLAIRAMLAMAVVTALIGVGQIVLNKFTGMTLTLVEELRETKPTFFGVSLRASGLTTWAQWLADLELIALPFLLFAALRAASLGARLAYLLALALVLTSIFFTFTYAAYGGVALILIVFPFVAWPHRSLHFLLAGALAVALFHLLGGSHWLVEHGLPAFMRSSGMVERKSYLLGALDYLARDPWFGSGVYADEEFSGNFYRKRVHNTGLQAWAYFGLPGFVLFVGMLLTTQAQLVLLSLSLRGIEREHCQALSLVIAAVLLTMFAQPNLTVPATWYLLGLAGAAIRVLSSSSDPVAAARRAWRHA